MLLEDYYISLLCLSEAYGNDVGLDLQTNTNLVYDKKLHDIEVVYSRCVNITRISTRFPQLKNYSLDNSRKRKRKQYMEGAGVTPRTPG